MSTNDSEHVCEVCGESYETYQALNAHKGQKHDTRAVIECRVCGSEFEVVNSEADSRYTCGEECKFIRQSEHRSGSDSPTFKSHISTEEIIQRYENGETTYEIAQDLGVSPELPARRLRKADVELRDGGYPRDVSTERGDLVRSHYERIVADHLYDNDIDYEYEPDGFGPWVPDFVVDGVVIEVWGVKGDERYNERRAKKESWYGERGIRCIGIEPDDIGSLDDKLGPDPLRSRRNTT